MKSIFLAYLAGFADGEGAIYYLPDRRRKNSVRVGFEVSQKDPAILRKLRNEFGGNLGYIYPCNKEGVYKWAVYRLDQAKKVLVKIAPYLRVEKKRLAAKFILNHRPGKRGRPSTRRPR